MHERARPAEPGVFAHEYQHLIHNDYDPDEVDGGATVTGESAADLQNGDANATIHFTGNAYNTLGAPPWGSDYIPLGPSATLSSVVFNGQQQFFFPAGPQWV